MIGINEKPAQPHVVKLISNGKDITISDNSDDVPDITLLNDDKIYNFLKSQGLYNDPTSYHQTDMIVFLDISSYDLDSDEDEQSFKYALVGLVYKLCILSDLIGKKKRLKIVPFGVACGAPIIIDAKDLAKTEGTNKGVVKKIKYIIDDAFMENESFSHGNFFSLPFEEMVDEFHKDAGFQSAQLTWWQLFSRLFGSKANRQLSILDRCFDKNKIKNAAPANVYVVTSTQQIQDPIAEHPSQLQKIVCKVSHLPVHYTLVAIDNSPKTTSPQKQPIQHNFLTQIKRFLLKPLLGGRRFPNLDLIDTPEHAITLQQLIGNYPKALLQAMENKVINRRACKMNWSAIAAARCCEEIAEPQLQARRVTKIKAIKWPSPRQPTFKKSAANTKHLVCLLQQNAAHSKQAVHNYLGH